MAQLARHGRGGVTCFQPVLIDGVDVSVFEFVEVVFHVDRCGTQISNLVIVALSISLGNC
jgi:hypothetical protein